MTKNNLRFCPATIFIILSILLRLPYTLALLQYLSLMSLFLLAEVVVNIYICVLLFKKSRDVHLLVCLGFAIGIALLKLISRLGTFPDMAAYAAMLILGLFFIKNDTLKIPESIFTKILRKLFFLPAVIIVIEVIIEFGGVANPVLAIFVHGGSIMNALALFFMAGWMVNPYKQKDSEFNN